MWNGKWISPSDRPSPKYTYQSDNLGYGAGLRLKRSASDPGEDSQFYWRGVERPQSINFKELATPAMVLGTIDRRAASGLTTPLRDGVNSGELN